ncbi:MAG: MFS transporter, partial [Ktedonobacterales bacterium]
MSEQQNQKDAPFAGHYWPTVVFVLVALCPDLFLSTSASLLRQPISQSLHASLTTLGLGETFSNAGWAFGAVLAAFLAQRFSGWKLNIAYETMFIIGSALGALAPNVWFVVAGRILQGTATGMLLVSALPPIIRGFPVARLGVTAGVTDLGLFGAATAGPVIGGYIAQAGLWRLFFATMGLLALGGLILT